MARVTVGILQAAPRGSKGETLRAVEKLLEHEDHRADVYLTPEYLMLDPTGLEPAAIAAAAEGLDGEWVGFFRREARERGACFVATMFERAGGRVYNSAVVIDESGEVVGVYRKTHLFDAYGYRESSFTVPGDRLFEPVSVCGVKLGLAICFELRFPEVFRAQALAGAELVAVPAAWYRGPLKEETLRFLAQARAHENTVFLAVASNPGSSFVGRSMVVDPMGVVRAELGPGEKYAGVQVDTAEVAGARRTLPVLGLRRPELYHRPG